ncbi:MAG: MFS transporter [Burkholderiaceae bacterium]|nr:MFS transporter [Burkholderiaceae bacterium]
MSDSPLPSSPPAAGPPAAALAGRWVMLLALIAGFSLSQAFRTVTAIMATGLQGEFALSPQQLGLFAGAFAFAFGGMQMFMGIGIDLFGLRRTVLVASPLTIAGALLSALAPGYGAVLLGQVLIGLGCAPAFLVCTVFVARYFEPRRFAFVSGLAMGLGGLGMLFTGTPLAWLVAQWSWRAGFLVLAVLALLAWLLIAWLVREPAAAGHGAPPGESVVAAVRSYGALFLLPHTLGILLLSLVTYAGFLTLRGLWLGPLLIERHHFSLVASGNVALIVSLISLVGPALFGRADPGPQRRRGWILGVTLVVAALFTAMALVQSRWVDVGGALLVGFLSGYIVLQYADVRSAYPPALTGRAMAVFTMAMFLGVALAQWLTGAAAALALAHGVEPYRAVFGLLAALLAAGALAFWVLPAPPGTATVPGGVG